MGAAGRVASASEIKVGFPVEVAFEFGARKHDVPEARGGGKGTTGTETILQ